VGTVTKILCHILGENPGDVTKDYEKNLKKFNFFQILQGFMAFLAKIRA